MDKNLPANAGGLSLILDLGRFHMIQKKKAYAGQLLSPHAVTTEACEPGANALQQAEPPQ